MNTQQEQLLIARNANLEKELATKNRELEIEVALEKVRAKTMAMHNSNDVGETAAVMVEELKKLGIETIRCGIGIMHEPGDMEVWTIRSNENDKSDIIIGWLDMHIHPLLHGAFESWQNKNESYSYELKDDDLISFYNAINNYPGYPIRYDITSLPKCIHHNEFAFAEGILFAFSLQQLTYEQRKIFKRFAGVFGQTYRRYLDLQKAEMQAKEARIEASLERVRSKAMAMHNSQDLADTIGVFYKELYSFSMIPRRCGVGLLNKINRAGELFTWNTTEKGGALELAGKIKMEGHPVLDNIYNNWLTQTEYHPVLRGNEIKEYYQMIRPQMAFPNYEDDMVQYGYFFYFNEGGVYAWTEKEMQEDELQIYRRFASVLSLTYKRYKDLQQAEAQAREAQIEAALERVRTRTMAMFKSDELAETAVVVFQQLISLGIEPNRLYIGIINDESGDLEFWMTDEEGKQVSKRYVVNIHKNISIKKMYEGWKEQRQTLSIDMSGNELHEWITYWNKEFGVPFILGAGHQRRVQNLAYFSKGFIATTTFENAPKEIVSLLNRFAAVFNLTYTRFNDLQLAEAQAREAQIQLALERVRAKTMAMHNSEDVTSATETMFEELQKLDINNLRGGIANIHPEKTMEVFGITNMTDGKTMRGFTLFDINAHPIWQRLFESWNNKEEVFIDYLTGAEKEDYFNVVNSHQNYLPRSIGEFPDTHFQSYLFDQGNIWTFSLQPHSDTDREIMKRFASVFALTFRRYQDLKKAEAQAREAQIEAALERVRGKAMAMHSSKDLAETIHVFYREIELLSVTPRRCGVGLLNKESRVCKLSTMTTTEEGEPVEVIGKLDLQGHPVLDGIYNNWLNQKDYHPVLRGNEIKEYYKLIRPQISYPDYSNDIAQHGYFFFFPEGGVFAWTEKELPEDELQIYRRFTSVISLTYKRYRDLQQAEANTREAIKQAALDRIRADIASMRTVSDLDRITPLIWNELTILGVPFIRCGVFIMDDEQQLIHTFLSTPDGKAIAAFHIPYNTPGNIKHVVSHWHENKNYIDHWDENAFTEFAKMLVTQSALASAKQYLKTIPRGGFYLHFLPFLQGMLYVGNTTQLNEDEINLIQSLADAFSTAYARYEDFNKLEAAKKQVDITLNELQATQKQLIQSEKMASLGELTAGIAHEIQNPLNFVNNFSEVNKEMIAEMKDEIDKGNYDDAKMIADDIKANEEKINHHGKRADAIVKGMLQHSRKSSGIKEPTDINALCDEYLRLSYHGLRAKDKSFNADFKTDFDESIGKINIVPQDIGRVLVNLINNAFYAVNEKLKAKGSKPDTDYKPLVSVQTKKINSTIEIKVNDNGNSIPQKIVDKIFQPFFTTKPTGEGTGLGLSLSYDIIKAHGGEIKVETKEGEGSEFIIQLRTN